ncbi:major facilitator transporter, partial [Pseudomonas syringae pv. pisi str. 1704B]
GLLFGALSMLIVQNLTRYGHTRSRSNLWLAACESLLGLSALLLLNLLRPIDPWNIAQTPSAHLALLLAAVAGLIYTYCFFVHRNARKLDRLLLGNAVLMGIGALLVLGVMVALILPLVSMLKDTPSVSTGVELTLGEALREACSHSGFWLLALGFFVCGFQVVFIGVHLPAYLVDQHLPAKVGTTVLALIGLFNIFGTYTAGWLGGRMSKPRLLTVLYLLRAVVIVLFLWIPLSQTTAYLFGVAMGLLW